MPSMRKARTGVKKYNFKRKRYNTSASMAKWRASKNPITQQAVRTGGWADPSLGGELKFIDVNSFGVALATGVNTWSDGVLLNGVTPGSGADNRIGRKITLKSLLVRWSINVTTPNVGSGRFRILVVYDKQANATAPAITDILLADSWFAPNNLSNRDRFVTLCDEYTDIAGGGGAGGHADTNDPCGMLKFKKLNLETMFNSGNAGTVADITSGSIYLFYSQPGTMTYTSCEMTFRSRIRFVDP